jgi:hypothetical protein
MRIIQFNPVNIPYIPYIQYIKNVVHTKPKNKSIHQRVQSAACKKTSNIIK